MLIEVQRRSISELKGFFDGARRRRGRHFTLLERSNISQDGGAPARASIAVITSKKNVGNLATKRNLAKRRLLCAMREVLRAEQVECAMQLEWVVLAGRSAAECKYAELIEEFKNCWAQTARDFAAKQGKNNAH